MNTVDALKVAAFELDPCGQEVLGKFKGLTIGRGNCTQPNVCTCLCYDRAWKDSGGGTCRAHCLVLSLRPARCCDMCFFLCCG